MLTALIKYYTKLVGFFVILSGDKHVFINHRQRHNKQLKPLPHMYIKVCTTGANSHDEPLSGDTDGILFIIDNLATAIISNVHKLFPGSLKPTRVTTETADSISTHTKLVGSLRLILTDNSNRTHVYTIPG